MNFRSLILFFTLAAVGADELPGANPEPTSVDYAARFSAAKNFYVLVRSVNRELIDKAKSLGKISPKVDQYHQEVSGVEESKRPYEAYIRSYHLKNDTVSKYDSAQYEMSLVRTHAQGRAWELNQMRKRPTDEPLHEVHRYFEETLALYNKTITLVYNNELSIVDEFDVYTEGSPYYKIH